MLDTSLLVNLEFVDYAGHQFTGELGVCSLYWALVYW